MLRVQSFLIIYPEGLHNLIFSLRIEPAFQVWQAGFGDLLECLTANQQDCNLDQKFGETTTKITIIPQSYLVKCCIGHRPFDKGDIEQRSVRIQELEKESFQDQRIFVTGIVLVVFPIVQFHTNFLPDFTHHNH
eukprot:Lithocolla_globosa_v1_NODE_2800_length_1864_cov_7.229409.p2 type:complete len:134 gc:universal NODE_2800_length_1864_cov_7.229409:990-1391(+)